VVNVGEETLETEHVSCQHGLLVNQAFVGELNDHASLLHEEEVFGDLRVVYNPLVGIERILFADFISNEVQDRIWDHGEEFTLFEYEVKVGLFPLGRSEVELKRLGVDDLIEKVVFIGLKLSVLIVFIDDVCMGGYIPLKE
jgi:hypothetical protein